MDRFVVLAAASLALLACVASPEDAPSAEDESTSEAPATSTGTDEAESSDAGESGDAADEADGGGNFIPEEGEDDEGEDQTATLACEALDEAPHQAVLAVADPADAGMTAFVPDPEVIYDVTLPEDGPGYVLLEVAGWGTVQAFYTSAEIDYEVSTSEGEIFPYPREPIPACPESSMTEQRIGFPHWGPALVEFGAKGPRLIPLLVIEE